MPVAAKDRRREVLDALVEERIAERDAEERVARERADAAAEAERLATDRAERLERATKDVTKALEASADAFNAWVASVRELMALHGEYRALGGPVSAEAINTLIARSFSAAMLSVSRSNRFGALSLRPYAGTDAIAKWHVKLFVAKKDDDDND